MSAKLAILVIALVAGLLAATVVTATVLGTGDEPAETQVFAADDAATADTGMAPGEDAPLDDQAPPVPDHPGDGHRLLAMRLARSVMPTLLEAYANGTWDGNLSDLPAIPWDASAPWYALPDPDNLTRDGNGTHDGNCMRGDGMFTDLPHRGPQFRHGFAHGFRAGMEHGDGPDRPDRFGMPPLTVDDPSLAEVGGLG